MEILPTLLQGDLFDRLKELPKCSIAAVITSPPYADQRKAQYGGIVEQEYPQWTVRWMEELRPALSEHASIAIVIRPHVAHGQVSDYVLRTRLAVREAGWCEADELIWIKPTAPALGHNKRPRRSWEHILWFSNSTKPFCDPVAFGVGVPSTRLGLESSKGMGDYLHDPEARTTYEGVARCRDYIGVATHETNRDEFNTHPAQYPEKLADWLIRLLCPREGTVLDPFAGSGTTLVAAKRAGYRSIGFEIRSDYIAIAVRRLAQLDRRGGDFFKFDA